MPPRTRQRCGVPILPSCWCPASACSLSAALAGSVAGTAAAAGTPPVGAWRRFRPHLTLARCGRATDVSDVVAALADLHGAPWTAADITLVHSLVAQRRTVAY
ncbi:MAG: 2'-5' RNA ligase family protein, partial [Sciscionella sp.]